MAVVLIAAPALPPELRSTVLWRDGVERRLARSADEARQEAAAGGVRLVVIDLRLQGAPELVESLRGGPGTRELALAVLATAPLASEERHWLEERAEAVLMGSPGPEWNERLTPLLEVRPRRSVRVPIRLELTGVRRGTRITGMAHNISESGMLVESVLALAVGEELRFSLTVPGSTEAISGRGRVVRDQQAAQGGVTAYGVRFNYLEGGSRARIRALVEATTRGGRS